MLHIATVHFRSPIWIEIQRRKLQQHLSVPYMTWASLEGIDPSYRECFDYTLDLHGSHAEKLNHLATEITRNAADDDLLMFLDGDAFPISDPEPLINSGLAHAPLMAVRRDENCNDPQPHPCFCVTDARTWNSLPGDWSEGLTWTGPQGVAVTDVGAQLLRRLELTGTPWTKVLRSNRHNVHPVFFGIYGGTIYHHGAGFRPPLSRADALHEGKVRTALRNLQLSQELHCRIRRDDPDWLAELI